MTRTSGATTRRRPDRRGTGTGPGRSSSSSSTGSGSAATRPTDAIAAAPMPTWRGLLRDWPHAVLAGVRGRRRSAAGPDGQLRGRVTSISVRAGRSSRTCRGSTPRSPTARFFERPALLEACGRAARAGRSAPHHQPHRSGRRPCQRPAPGRARGPRRTARACRAVRVHALLDGRDTPPRSAIGFVADLERRLAAAHSGCAHRIGRRALLRDGSRQPLGPGRARVRRDRPRRCGEHAGSAIAAIEAGYERGENDEFLAPTVIDGVDGAVRSGDPIDPRQLPCGPGAPAGPRPGRSGRSTAFDRTVAGRPARPDRPARRDDDRIRGRPPGRGRLPARGGALAGPGLLRGRLAPVPRRRDREIRPRDVLLQRRRRGALSRGGAAASFRAHASRPTTSSRR